MTLRELYDYLDQFSPFELQEEWDNSGLQIGNWEKGVSRVYISLDIDNEVVAKARENSVLVVHHPLFFRPLKSLTPSTGVGRYVMSLIKKGIAVIAMHTNLDKTHLNRYFAEEVLNLRGEQKGFIYYAQLDMLLDEWVELVGARMGLSQLRVVKSREYIRKCAVVTGSGCSLMDQLEPEVDLLMTGDIKYHDAMEAKGRGLALIDIGHYESERYFTSLLYPYLSRLDELEVTVLNSSNPFDIISIKK
jgi:dinuclear metal center YbgI/SA1388 family protein